MNTAVTKISTVAIGIIQAIEAGQMIYTIVANAMDSIESQATTHGADKKIWVLAYAKNVVLALGENWDELVKEISIFIDTVKAAYNVVKGLFT